MSYLRAKSDFNFSAAEVLIDKTLFAPSVHCSYYSCFQLLKHTLSEFCGVSFSDQTVQILKEGNSHKYTIREVLKEVHKNDKLAYGNLHRKINDLKTLRLKSDYDNIEITTTESNQAVQLAREIRNYITNNM